MNGLKVLRRVEGLWPNIEAELDQDQALIEFEDGTTWVDNDRPWDAVTGHHLVTHTVEFMVTDGQYGKLAGPYKDLAKCEEIRRNAKVQIVSVVDDLEDEADEPVVEVAQHK